MTDNVGDVSGFCAPLEFSVYDGSARLGRYVQNGPKEFKAFDENGRPLGNFRNKARMLRAIRRGARS